MPAVIHWGTTAKGDVVEVRTEELVDGEWVAQEPGVANETWGRVFVTPTDLDETADFRLCYVVESGGVRSPCSSWGSGGVIHVPEPGAGVSAIVAGLLVAALMRKRLTDG